MEQDERKWYVMLHGNPRLIDFQLRRENLQRQAMQGGQTAQLEYFIPFRFLSHVAEHSEVADRQLAENINRLRDDFHDFIFIHATPAGIAAITRSRWNRSIRIPLHHYRDIQRQPVVLTDKEMKTLIRVFSERRIKFTIGLPVTDVVPDEQVVITSEGTFCGQQARVIAVSHAADGISLTLGIPMFGGTKELKLSDVRLEQIQTERRPDDIIGLRFIGETEQSLLDILSRRINHKDTDEQRRQDLSLLNHLFLYSYITVNDPSMATHFLALMLLCSSLRNDQDSTRVLAARAIQLLDGASTLNPALRAYLHFALFLSTRNADHRDQGVRCVHQHPDAATDTLRRLMSLSRRLRTRK